MTLEKKNTSELIKSMKVGDTKSLSRCISIVENESEGYKQILQELHFDKQIPVIGVTGPPGAGKSSLVNELTDYIAQKGKKIGIIAVDPTSPFNYGSLLGDRVRMSGHFTNPNVFIRSMATRGSLGGLSQKIYEVTDLMKNACFDVIIIETVGVGQSEVEIAGLADTTIVVMVPEAGDEVQTIKSGVMEIADIFVVNKSDREGADAFVKNLEGMVHGRKENKTPVIKTIATKKEGIDKLYKAIETHHSNNSSRERKAILVFEKTLRLVVERKIQSIDKQKLKRELTEKINTIGFNLYNYIDKEFPI